VVSVDLVERDSPRLRCAYCHDSLRSGAVDCERCGAQFHGDCAATFGKCPTLGCGIEVKVPRKGRRWPRRSLGVAVLALIALGAWIGFSDLTVSEGSHPADEFLGPASPPSTTVVYPTFTSAERAAREAWEALHRDDFPRALAVANHALALDPRSRLALEVRTRVLLAYRDYHAAARDIDLAIELDPTDWSLRVERATVRLCLGDIRGARAEADEAVKLDPDQPRAHLARARIELDQREFAAAKQAALRALALWEENSRGTNETEADIRRTLRVLEDQE
jgi:tetratricopeptide (TPR) repeat protein